MYSTVSGGPIGSEQVISTCGPRAGLIGLLIFPLLYTTPLALVTAELCTMYPVNGGFVVWVDKAFGPFWSFQMGVWQWFAGVLDSALYPVLALDTLKLMVPAVAKLGAFPLWCMKAGFAGLLILLALAGVKATGPAITVFNALSLIPFLVLVAVCIPQMDTANLHWGEQRSDITLASVGSLFSLLFWNYNGVHQVFVLRPFHGTEYGAES